jgi:hypothetical protein
MGLDIHVYPEVNFDERVSQEEGEENWGLYTYLYAHTGYPDRHEGIETGYYSKGDEGDDWGFRAGSYSGYSAWRRWLCTLVYGMDIEKFWDEAKEGPFWELLNFSDCEGFIGPKTSAKLAGDFEDLFFALSAGSLEHLCSALEGKEAPMDLPGRGEASSDPWLMEVAKEWHKAFRDAAHTGVVRFC